MDHRTDSYFAFDSDRSLVDVHHILYDFCSKPRSTSFSADNLCGEQCVPHLRGHPSPRICNGEHEGARLDIDLSTHRDGSTGGDFRNSVIDQVVESSEQATLIRLDDRQRFKTFGMQCDPFLCCIPV